MVLVIFHCRGSLHGRSRNAFSGWTRGVQSSSKTLLCLLLGGVLHAHRRLQYCPEPGNAQL